MVGVQDVGGLSLRTTTVLFRYTTSAHGSHVRCWASSSGSQPESVSM